MTQPSVEYRKLRRPFDDRMVAGVCSGLARYFGVDPVLVRIGFAVLALVTWGVALIAYPLLWVIMPDTEPTEQQAWRDPADPTWGQPHQPTQPYQASPPMSTPTQPE